MSVVDFVSVLAAHKEKSVILWGEYLMYAVMAMAAAFLCMAPIPMMA